ncbi:MAG: hypothetical protein RL026_1981 [Pseudomonadota bacterium]|jgi:AcrR family transcriptional regulator
MPALSDGLYERTSVDAMTDTRTRYLDAAEAAFIRDGYEGATIRAISARAKVPLGTLHHYWGTKERLFTEVCQRRFGPIQQVQVARLQAVGAAAGEGRPDLEAVVRAMIEPPVLPPDASVAQRRRIRALYGRVLTEPHQAALRQVVHVFRDSTQLFIELMQRACPQLDARTFFWRYTCALGTFIFANSFSDRVALSMDYELTEEQWPQAVDEMAAFMVRGMSAPAG